MSAKDDSIMQKLIGAINQMNESKTSAYDTEAEVIRIDGKTAWVHIPGGIDETPVSRTIDAKPGDVVQVRVSGGTAFLVGNGSAPPTDDTTAVYARNIADVAQTTAESAQEVADTAQGVAANANRLAEGINEHFWYNSTGAHITEDTQEDYEADPANAGGNVLITSQGMAIRKGQTELASFTANNGIRIGRSEQAHVDVDYHSLQAIDKNNNAYFYVSDLRDINGDTAWTDIFTGDGTLKVFNLTLTAKDTNYTVTVSDSSGGTQTKATNKVTFSSAPTNGATITVTYITQSMYAKAYTLGIRSAGETVAPMSYAEGVNIESSGYCSHAEGDTTKASGGCSHAEGRNNQATGANSHAEGGGNSAHGNDSHAEGLNTFAIGTASHSEGSSCSASGFSSHAEGVYSEASGYYSHAQNSCTIAGHFAQTAIGQYNENKSNNAFEIGNGNYLARSNAFEVDWSGNVEAAGDIHATGDISADGRVILNPTHLTVSKSFTNTSQRVSLSSGTTNKTVLSVTAPISGIVMVSGYIAMTTNATGNRHSEIKVGGITVYMDTRVANGTNNGNMGVAASVPCTAGDTIEIQAWQTSGSTLYAGGRLDAVFL